MSRTTLLGRAGATLVASAVTVSLILASGTAQAASADRGVGWLAGQLDNGAIVNGGFADYGLSIDTAFALKAVGGHGTDVQQIRDAVEQNVGDYIAGDSFGDPGSTYAGATAKSLVLAQSTGTDPRALRRRGPDQAAERRGPQSGPAKGRIVDVSNVRGLRQHPRPDPRGARPRRGRKRQGRLGPAVPAPAAVPRGLLPAELRQAEVRQPGLPEEQPRRPRRHVVRRRRALEDQQGSPGVPEVPQACRLVAAGTSSARAARSSAAPARRRPTPTAPASRDGRSPRRVTAAPPRRPRRGSPGSRSAPSQAARRSRVSAARSPTTGRR